MAQVWRMTDTSDASPYAAQPAHAFWRSAVVERQRGTVAALHQPRFALTPKTQVMTAGSCFAQHLHRKLTALGWGVILEEDVTGLIPPRVAKSYGYGLYSARYGNIYTARQFLELIEEAMAETPPPPVIWEREGRYFDALRPSVEPKGLGSVEEVANARAAHLDAVRDVLCQAECVIFTLGLTEAWIDDATGRTLPTAPGTIAGNMRDTPAQFVNFGYEDVLADMEKARALLKAINPEMSLLLTVSPVPLTATATHSHIAAASTASKAILRAVCDTLLRRHGDIDYFPSYEIITTPVLGGPHFADNLRTPSDKGVRRVMKVFEDAYGGTNSAANGLAPQKGAETPDWDVECEEILLEAFAK